MPEDDDDLEGVLDDNHRRELRDARKQRAQLAEQQQRAAQAEMRAAMAEAQIPRDGLGALFRDAYKGEPDPDAILAKAKEYGIFDGTPSNPPPSSPNGDTALEQAALQAELARLQAAQGTVGGGGPPQPTAAESFFAELAAIPDKQSSSRVGQQAVMDLVAKFQREHPEVGIYTKGTR